MVGVHVEVDATALRTASIWACMEAMEAMYVCMYIALAL